MRLPTRTAGSLFFARCVDYRQQRPGDGGRLGFRGRRGAGSRSGDLTSNGGRGRHPRRRDTGRPGGEGDTFAGSLSPAAAEDIPCEPTPGVSPIAHGNISIAVD